MEQQGFEERLAKELQSKKKTSITNKVETVKSRQGEKKEAVD